MPYIQEQHITLISVGDMDFGTEENSLCGICGCKEEGYWKNGVLQEDIICSECAEIYEYDCDTDNYRKKEDL